MSKISEIAQRIGFTVKQLAVVAGYSRAGLYEVLVYNKESANRGRLQAAVKAVKYAIEEEYQRDVQELEARYAERRKAAEELLYITKEGEP